MPIYHKHHVVPRHAGGTDDPSNLTCPLTIQEHAEHHRYRYEMLGEWQDRIAWQSLIGMIPKQEAIRQIHVENGKASRGKTRSEETRRKISNILKNRSEETRRKMSEAHRGKPNPMTGKSHSEETRRKMSEAHRGKTRSPHSEETRQKISEALRGKTIKL